MSFHVEIEFGGLCFFRVGYPDKKKVTVLLVNTAVGMLTCQPDIPVTPHCPRLVFHTPLKDGPKEIDLSSGYLLRIGDDNGGVSRDYRKLTHGARPWPPTNLGGDAALHWIPSLQVLLRDETNQPVLRRDCEQGGPLGDRVVARIELNEGNLTSCRIAKFAGRPLEWQFKDTKDVDLSATKDYWRQALTDRVKLSIKNLSSPLEIEMTPASGGPGSVIAVEPKKGRYAKLSILNEPCGTDHTDGNGDLRRVPHEEHTEHPKVLRDFLWYYELLEDCPSAFPIPTTTVVPDNIRKSGLLDKLIPRKLWRKIYRDVNVFCPPATWSG